MTLSIILVIYEENINETVADSVSMTQTISRYTTVKNSKIIDGQRVQKHSLPTDLFATCCDMIPDDCQHVN